MRRALGWGLTWIWIASCRCESETHERDAPLSGTTSTSLPSEDAIEPTFGAQAPTAGVVHHTAELAALDTSRLESLDLALAEADRLGRLSELDASTVCDGLDLEALGARAPKLRRLRLSGCGEAARSIGALAELEQLTLSDLQLDPEVLVALARLPALRRLVLARVDASDELALEGLGALALHEIELVELQRDSALGNVLRLWPTTLRRATLVGSWAGHHAMQALSKALALERLELRDTRVGNFSLNQIKPLSRLRELDWSGDTFNDNSPLYFRDLAVERFACECPRFGDAGLHTLRHCPSVKELTLERTRVTGEGLAALARLPELRALTFDRDVGLAGLEALAALPGLRRLDLSGTAEEPRMTGLGALVGLQQLRLRYPELDDRAAAELGRLRALRELDLAGTRLSDVGLAQLAPLTELEYLALSHTRVTNRGLSHLAGMPKLRYLLLDHTDVVDAGVQHLAQLRALETLRLDHTLVTDASVEHLLALAKLVRLDLRGTVVSEVGLARLSTLPELAELTHGADRDDQSSGR